MDDIYIQEFLVMVFTGADVQPYGLNCTASLKFTVMPEIGKPGMLKDEKWRWLVSVCLRELANI